MALLLLALTTYLAGVYIEPTCIVVGILLGIFAAGIALLDTYLYNVLLPVTVAATILVIVILHHVHKKTS